MVAQVRKVGTKTFFTGLLSKDRLNAPRPGIQVFQPVRQPIWWNGDAVSPTRLHRAGFRAGTPVESRGIRGDRRGGAAFDYRHQKADPEHRVSQALRGGDQFYRSTSATPRMSSWACSTLAVQNGAEPVMQIAAATGPALACSRKC